MSLALLAGCAPTPPTSNPTRALETSPTPSVATSDSAEPIDSADPASWLISADGIGPISIGQTVDDTVLALAAFASLPVPCENDAYLMYQLTPDLGLTIAIGDGTTVRAVGITTDFDGAATVASPRTTEGVGLGSTIADVQSVYPDAVPVEGSAEYIHVEDGDTWISFSPEFGDVTVALSIDVAQGWSIPSEFC